MLFLSRFPARWTSLLGFLLGALALFLSVNTLTRLTLLAQAAHHIEAWHTLPLTLAWGLFFDLATFGWWLVPLLLFWTFTPQRFFAGRRGRWALALGLFLLSFLWLFLAVAENVFWEEYGVRFNFIAVDYLVYTTEVIGNIRESYPLNWILAGIAAAALAVTVPILRYRGLAPWLQSERPGLRGRLRQVAAPLVLGCGLGLLATDHWLPHFPDNYQRELAKNGTWSLFEAFRANELEFHQFYQTLPDAEAWTKLDTMLRRPADAPPRDTLRAIRNPAPEIQPNVIQITVESLSAEFLGSFGNTKGITPRLDALAPQSLFFTRYFATGNRTDRGMEALTLSLPPTPGRSLVKRPENANLFSLGSVFRSRGYDTAFIYGGYGYFDNMNKFFGANGYRVVDRTVVGDEDITFANVWGACDEDLFRWTMREADQSAAAGKPFHYFVMTTSNHRPYTFPEGRIDLPSKVSGRSGAVKYTDFAIGQFLEQAAAKPWFRNTLFIITADHCASSAGKTDLPPDRYHIPLFIYAPGGQVKPGRCDELIGEPDVGPTLLGLMGWDYTSRFYGRDIFNPAERPDRPIVYFGTYQKLGAYDGRHLVVLGSRKDATGFDCGPSGMNPVLGRVDDDLRRRAIAAYQTASELYQEKRYGALEPKEP